VTRRTRQRYRETQGCSDAVATLVLKRFPENIQMRAVVEDIPPDVSGNGCRKQRIVPQHVIKRHSGQ
jgi:hypothetical protein